MTRILHVLFVALFLSSEANAQVAFVFDVDGDGIEDRFLPVAGTTNQWAVVSGSNLSVVLSTYEGLGTSELFGLFNLGLSNITPSGRKKFLALAPGYSVGGHMRGACFMYEVGNPDPLWAVACPIGNFGGLGAALIPDQDLDGVPDLLIRLVDSSDLLLERAYLLSGNTGTGLRLLKGEMADFADQARAGTLLYAKTDLDHSTLVDDIDLLVCQILILNGDTRADVDGDGILSVADLFCVVSDMQAGLQLGADMVTTPTSRMTIPASEALRRYEPDRLGPFVITDSLNVDLIRLDEIVPRAAECDPVIAYVEFAHAVQVAQPEGQVVPCNDIRPRPLYIIPPPNGCGGGWASGLLTRCSYFHGLFTPCCNTHDNCYGTCNIGRGLCDTNFFGCMLGACNGLPTRILRWKCYQHAYIFYQAVNNWGGGAYDAAQALACICCDPPNPPCP